MFLLITNIFLRKTYLEMINWILGLVVAVTFVLVLVKGVALFMVNYNYKLYYVY